LAKGYWQGQKFGDIVKYGTGTQQNQASFRVRWWVLVQLWPVLGDKKKKKTTKKRRRLVLDLFFP
jgi:hypothetical protein